MLHIQRFLRTNSIETLNAKYGIRVSTHKDYPNLHCFKYNMIESPMDVSLVQEARGIVLDKNNDWNVVSYPYNKFFNAGEPLAVAIDWSTAYCLEKLDGSLMTLYHYDNKWHVMTSGMPDADGAIHPMLIDITFKKIFWNIWNEMGYKLPTNTDECYMFEMMSKYNRLVCKYDSEKIVFHGARNIKTYQELPHTYGKEFGWEIVKSYPIDSLSALFKTCRKLNPLEQEGFVVVDKYFNRIKVKSPEYVALSHMKDGMSSKKLLSILFSNETDEFLTYFPEFTEVYSKLKTYYKGILNNLEIDYAKVKNIKDDKEFAITIAKHRFKNAMFSARRFNKSFEQYFVDGFERNPHPFIKTFLAGIQMSLDTIKSATEQAVGQDLKNKAIKDNISYNSNAPKKTSSNLFSRKGSIKKYTPTLYFLRGLPASGKSTKAKELIQDRNNIVILSLDDIRNQLFNIQKDGHTNETHECENTIRKLERNLALTYLQAKVDVVIDDTNLPEARFKSFKAVANQFKANFIEINFFHVSPEECIERNKNRKNSVPEQVIQNMADQFIDESLWQKEA